MYKEKKTYLETTKEKLYAKKDVSKWKLDTSNSKIPLQQISNDKELAIKYMLPIVRHQFNLEVTKQETSQVEHVKEYWAFYNQQLLDQTKVFAQNTITRMKTQAGRFIKVTTENYANLQKLWDNLHKNIVEGKKDVVISLGLSKTRRPAATSGGSNPQPSDPTEVSEKPSTKEKKDDAGKKNPGNIFYEETSSEEEDENEEL